MADKQKKKRVLKTTVTMRERTKKAAHTEKKPRVLRGSREKIIDPLRSAAATGKKEYYLPLPNNKLGQFFNKRRTLIPGYFRESFRELRLVAWPTRRETIKMTFAVFIFAILLSLLITAIDYGLDKVFRKVFLS